MYMLLPKNLNNFNKANKKDYYCLNFPPNILINNMSKIIHMKYQL